MRFSIRRETLLKPLQQVIGVVERRQTMPMLGNVLLRASDLGMKLVATDLEVELVTDIEMAAAVTGETTLPARKLLDICRSLPEGVELRIEVSEAKATIHARRSRFVLATLPAADFPILDQIQADRTLKLTQTQLKTLLDRTAFGMAQQDVRYYLNGLLLHFDEGALRSVATDGHRLATCRLTAEIADEATQAEIADEATQQVIIPRKAIHELQRLLTDAEQALELEISSNHIRLSFAGLCFTSKLIDGRFPDYERVLPRDCDKVIFVEREALRQALIRTAILSSEKYRGVRISLDGATMKIQAHNPEQEEAEEEMEVDYDGENLEIGFNVNYLLDVLNVIESDTVEINLKDPNSSALLKSPGSDEAVYVVMPMRL
jgi:DNA polymerase-3 subunit beta